MDTGGSITQPEKWDKRAIDFGLDNGSAVTAAADGIVVDVHLETNAFGLYVIVDHGGYYTMYAHLSDESVTIGDRVRLGEQMGKAGNSGVLAYHLHFQTGKGTSSSIFPYAPEVMAGIRTSNSNYEGWDNFGQWGWGDDPNVPGVDCGSFVASPFWYSASPLSDAVLYSSSSGDTDTRHAKGDGTWTAMEDADTTTLAASMTVGFFGHIGSATDDEVSDLLFYNPGVGATNRWETWIRKADSADWTITDSDSIGEPVFMTGAKVFPAELNGDGLTDIILYDDDIGTTAKFETWLADPSDPGSWIAGSSNATWTESWELVTGNFDADNLTDVLTYNPNGTGWRVRRANTSGNGGFTTLDNGNFAGCCNAMLVGYFNDDRISDTYRYDAAGTYWSVRFGNGSGNWTWAGDGNWGGAMTHTHPGYFNDGKKTDLLRYDAPTGDCTTKIADGSGGWSDNQCSFGANRTLYTASLDQDRRTDLVLYKASDGAVGVRFSTGSGQWTSDQCSGCFWDAGQTMAVGFLDRETNAS